MKMFPQNSILYHNSRYGRMGVIVNSLFHAYRRIKYTIPLTISLPADWCWHLTALMRLSKLRIVRALGCLRVYHPGNRYRSVIIFYGFPNIGITTALLSATIAFIINVAPCIRSNRASILDTKGQWEAATIGMNRYNIKTDYLRKQQESGAPLSNTFISL